MESRIHQHVCVYSTVGMWRLSHYTQGWSAGWKVTMFTDLFVRCTSGEGSQWPSDSHTMSEKYRNPDVRGMKKKKKKHSPGLCFCLLVPQSTLPVFIDLSMSFGPVSDILSSLSNGQTGSGFVRIKVECWDKSCPLCAPVSVGAAAGHLLCCVKTHLYGMNAEFQLER